MHFYLLFIYIGVINKLNYIFEKFGQFRVIYKGLNFFKLYIIIQYYLIRIIYDNNFEQLSVTEQCQHFILMVKNVQ